MSTTEDGRPRSRNMRAAAVTAVAGLGLVGLAGCSGDSDQSGPLGDVTVEELQALEDQVAGLDQRLGELEAGEAGVGDDNVELGGEGDVEEPAFFGQEATVTAEVTDILPTTEAGTVFRIAGDQGEPITVITAAPVPGLDLGEVVVVTGIVVEIRDESFADDFGVAAEDLFEDPDGWFADAEGQVAIAGDAVTPQE